MAGKTSGIEVRPNSIRIRLRVGGLSICETLMVSGEPVAPTPANLRYAARVADDIRRRVALGTFDMAEFFPHSPRAAPAQATTLGALLDDWLKSKGTLAPASQSQYASAVRFWKTLLGPSTRVSDITYKVLAAKVGSHPWPSAKTHNNYLIALRGAFDLEYRGEQTGKNPAAGLQNMRAVRRIPDPLSAAERDKVLADLREHCPTPAVAYFLWQFYTGMRPEETIALRWSDIDTVHLVARVQRVRTFRGSERDGTKTNTVRDVDLLPQALEALSMMRPITSMAGATQGNDGGMSPDIFQNPITGKPWHDERSQRDTFWRPSLSRAGVRYRTAYATRHTFATAALMGGVPPAYIAAQLGHSVKMLLDRYARWIPGGDGGGARAAMAVALGVPQPKTGV